MLLCSKIIEIRGIKKMNQSPAFQLFIQQADCRYKERLATLNLFDKTLTSNWDQSQKKYFAAIFYHLRGHFINFMWYIANFSDNQEIKKIIIQNIKEELGIEGRFSHEKLYALFAKEFNVDIHDEVVNQTHYLPFAKQFNQEHLLWLSQHDIDSQLAAFAAYERLDNIDYPHLTQLAESIGASDKTLAFFKVHIHVEHFESTWDVLIKIWLKSPVKVINAFDFIYSHQYHMWKKLSDAILAQR